MDTVIRDDVNNFHMLLPFIFSVELTFPTELKYKFRNDNEWLCSLKMLIGVRLKYKTLMASYFVDSLFLCENIFL